MTATARPRVLVVDDDGALRLAIASLLDAAGYQTEQARDGPEALRKLQHQQVELLLLDIGLPGMSGLDVLAETRRQPAPPRIIMMTADDTPEILLRSFQEQADRFIRKPFPPRRIVEIANDVLSASPTATLPIEVVSARPEWVELLVPCTREAAGRLETVMAHLDANLAPDVRESIAYAFRELLLNAVEWGGKLDPSRTVRIACLRANRMLMYRIADPGTGFDIEQLPHAAIGQPADDPIAHMHVREAKGIRPGGFGLLTVRASVDELLYNEQRNEVVFIKYLDS